MEARTYIIVGGVVLVIGLLSFFMGSTKRAETHYADAETLYQHRDYQGAIVKYQKAIKASKKLGAKTKHIHKDFPGLANYKIALCYDKLGETKNDNRFYAKAISLIDKTKDETKEYQLREKLYFLWAQILRKTEDYVQAELKYSYFLSEFPNSTMVHEALYYDGIINKELLRYKDSQESFQRINDSQESFQRIIDEFPTSKYRGEAEYYIAQLLVADTPEPDNAISKSEEQNMYNAAIEKIENNEVYEAYQLLLAIIKRYPESQLLSNTYEKIGDIYYKADNLVNARQYYEDAMDSTTDKQRKGLLNDKYQRTLLVPVTLEQKDNNDSKNELFVKATLMRKNQNYHEAAKLYETLSNIDITSNVKVSKDDIIYTIYWSGFCYYKAAKTQGNLSFYKKSTELFRRLIDEYGDTSELIKAYFYLASAYWEWGNAAGYDNSKYRLVIDTVNAVNRNTVNDRSTDYYVWKNQLLDLKLKAEKEISPYSAPVPTDNRQEAKLVEEARIHYFNDEIEKATDKAKEAVNFSSDYQPAKQLLSKIRDKYYANGWTFLDENLYDYAIDEFEKCIDIDPKFKKAHCNLGVIYIIKGNYSTAINVLKQAIDIDENFKEAYYNIGLAYLKLGQYDKAKDAANTALLIDPNYEAAKILRDSMAD